MIHESFIACIHRGSSTNLHAAHRHGGQVVGVLLVPAEPEQWVVLGVFVDDSAVFEVAEVKHADRAVCSHWGKHVPAAARSTERDVIHLQCKQTSEFWSDGTTDQWRAFDMEDGKVPPKRLPISTILSDTEVWGPSCHNIYLFVMGNELRFDVTRHQVDPAQHLSSLQAPDCTGGVDTGSTCTENRHPLLVCANLHAQIVTLCL